MTDQSKHSDDSRLTERGRRRLTKVIILSIVLLLLMLSLIAQGGFNLTPFVTPDTAAETLLLYALSTLNFLAFVTLLFVLLRNVLKLVRERRTARLGSKFKSRLVSYAIGLIAAAGPVAVLFCFWAFESQHRPLVRRAGATDRGRRARDRRKLLQERRSGSCWQRPRDCSKHSLRFAGRLRQPGTQIQTRSGNGRPRSGAGADRISGRTRRRSREATSRSKRDIKKHLNAAEQQIRAGAESFSGNDEGDSPTAIFVIAAVRLSSGASEPQVVIVAREFPPELTQRAATISEQHENFHSMLGKIKRIKAIYILLLAAVTLLLIFSASWLALYVARGITIPIQALAEATDRVAKGDFGRPVEVVAEDELAVLVKSFNQMAAMLAENRERLEHAADDLSRINLALDNRRRYIETVLESLSTGVISTDENAGIATINRSALWMLGLKDKPEDGTPIDRVVEGPQGEELAALCRRARRSEIAQSEIEFKRADGSSLSTATTAIALRNSDGAIEGLVIVIEDLTDLDSGRTRRRVGRSCPPDGPRDQEPAHSDSAFGRTHHAKL